MTRADRAATDPVEDKARELYEAWDEGYRAGSQDMSDLRAGRLTFQTITSNPYR